MIPGSAQPEPMRVRVQLRMILVVDEALPIRRKLMEILSRTGVSSDEMRAVENAEEALDVFAKQHPTVVFTELIGDDAQAGLDMVHEMLALDPLVRIVLVTAEDPSGPLVRAAVRAGVFAVVPKPLRHEKVRQVLAEIDSEEGGIQRFR